MRFEILGPLEVSDDYGGQVAVSRRLHRSMLTLLLLNAGRPRSAGELIATLWGDQPPLSPEVSLRTCVYGLRKLLPDAQRLRTHPSGYLIQVRSGELDLHDFRDLTGRGREALDRGDPQTAATMLARALDLWREPPAADLPDARGKNRLLDQRREVQDTLMDARLALGRHRQVVSELRSIVAEDPLREHAWAQLMTALYRCGARAEALAAFGRLRMTLVSAYGIEPGPELQDLHRQVLTDDPALMITAQAARLSRQLARPAAEHAADAAAQLAPDAAAQLAPDGAAQPAADAVARPAADATARPAADAAAEPAADAVAAPAGGVALWRPPCQLPAPVADFTGRASELSELLGRLPGDGMMVTVLHGMPGIGKTELALHAAQLARPGFPDGQLCAWLDDGGQARHPQVVLGELLRGLGVPPGEIPDGRFEREAMYRSVLAGCQVLVLADGASSAAQVRPLLPSGPGSAVIVTSRARLADLAGARLLELGGLLPADSVRMLASVCGRHGLSGADAESALAIARACEHLPLAMRIAGARLADDPDLTVPALAGLLADEQSKLDVLAVGDVSVRARLAAAAKAVSGQARTALALLGATGLRDTPEWLITLLLEDPAARQLTRSLARAGLLQRLPGGQNGDVTYRMHPLVRAYAGELLAEADPGIVGSAAGRLLASGWLELARGGISREPARTA